MAKSSQTPTLGPGAIRVINRAVDDVFDRAKIRILGPQSISRRLYVGGYNRHLSLPGIFESAAREEGTIPNLEQLAQILKIAGNYIDSTRERTKAMVVKEVQSFLTDAHHKKVDTDLQTVLGGKLSDVWTDTVTKMRQIIEAEANTTKNVGVLDGIMRINAVSGIDDPCVYFVVVRDRFLCDECKRLHLMPDEKTPRLWLMSEITSGYHKKGDPTPAMGGLHPHCRCTLVTLMPSYGFSKDGFVQYIGRDHNEFEAQRK